MTWIYDGTTDHKETVAGDGTDNDDYQEFRHEHEDYKSTDRYKPVSDEEDEGEEGEGEGEEEGGGEEAGEGAEEGGEEEGDLYEQSGDYLLKTSGRHYVIRGGDLFFDSGEYVHESKGEYGPDEEGEGAHPADSGGPGYADRAYFRDLDRDPENRADDGPTPGASHSPAHTQVRLDPAGGWADRSWVVRLDAGHAAAYLVGGSLGTAVYEYSGLELGPSTELDLKAFWNEGGDDAASFALDATPGVGEVKALQEFVTGVNLVTGEELDWFDRGVGLIGLFPVLGDVAVRGIRSGRAASGVARNAVGGGETIAMAARADDALDSAEKTIQRLKRTSPIYRTTEDFIDGLTGVTRQSDEIATALRDGQLKLKVLDSVGYSKAWQSVPGSKGFGGGTDGFYYAGKMFIREDADNLLAVAVHEGTHHLDMNRWLDGDWKVASYNVDKIPWERRAYFHERQFKIATGANLKFDTLLDMMGHITKWYSKS